MNAYCTIHLPHYFQNKNDASQQLLMPEQLVLHPTNCMIPLENKDILRKLGFVIDSFGASTLIIHGCPVELSQHPLKQLLEGLVEQFKWNNSKLTLSASENVIRALAKRASLPAGKKLSNLEQSSLRPAIHCMHQMVGRYVCYCHKLSWRIS